MITIKRHPNLDNWINISFFGKIIEQTTSRAEALKVAESVSRKHKAKVYDLDKNPIHLRNAKPARISWSLQPFRADIYWRQKHYFAKGLRVLPTKTKRQNLVHWLRTCKLRQVGRDTGRNFWVAMSWDILLFLPWVAVFWVMFADLFGGHSGW